VAIFLLISSKLVIELTFHYDTVRNKVFRNGSRIEHSTSLNQKTGYCGLLVGWRLFYFKSEIISYDTLAALDTRTLRVVFAPIAFVHYQISLS
jgi:hypothetical protein